MPYTTKKKYIFFETHLSPFNFTSFISDITKSKHTLCVQHTKLLQVTQTYTKNRQYPALTQLLAMVTMRLQIFLLH
jgi:hypothetical protein